MFEMCKEDEISIEHNFECAQFNESMVLILSGLRARHGKAMDGRSG